MPSDPLLRFWERELAPRLLGKVCWIGIGNTQRGDDGVGPALIERLANQGWQTVDAGVAPENHLEKVVNTRPDTLLLVDAADWGGRPGAVQLLEPGDAAALSLSTHALSLDLVAAYWAERLPQARIHLLAIQPGSLEWEPALSPAVADTVNQLVHCMRGLNI